MRVAVFGIGNVLVGDDAIGPSVISLLESEYDIPEEVVVEDLGTPSLDLAARLMEFDAVVFIDAVSAQLPPGTIRVYTLEEILRHPPGLRVSPHDPSLKETLLTARFAGDRPRHVRLVGVVPQSTEDFGLTETAKQALPKAAAAVIRELSILGICVHGKAVFASHSPWWAEQGGTRPL